MINPAQPKVRSEMRGTVNIHGFDLPNFLRAVVGDYSGGLGNGARQQLFHERALDMK